MLKKIRMFFSLFSNMNCHELSINYLCAEIHDQLHGNYMLKKFRIFFSLFFSALALFLPFSFFFLSEAFFYLSQRQKCFPALLPLFQNMNCHELSINFLCSAIHDQLHGNYMLKKCLHSYLLKITPKAQRSRRICPAASLNNINKV